MTRHDIPFINDYDVVRFTEGDCHILARQINRLTGWPMFVFHPDTDDDFFDEYGDLHAFVQHPSGMYLDIEDLWEPEKFFERWGERRVKSMPWEKMREAWAVSQYGDGQSGYLRAAQVARALIRRYS